MWQAGEERQIQRFEQAQAAWRDVVAQSDPSKSPLFTSGDEQQPPRELKLSKFFETSDVKAPKQCDITTAIMAKTLSAIIEQAGAVGAKELARYRSTKGIGTSEYLHASRRHNRFRLSSLELRVAVALRIGLDLPEISVAVPDGRCILCKAEGIEDPISHSLHCSGARTDYLRHDIIKHLLMDLARASGRSGSTEVDFPRGGTEIRRMDGVIPSANSNGGTLAIDVTVPDPLVPSWVDTAAQESGLVAKAATKAKHRTYDEATSRLDWEFVAPVFELLGYWGKDALKFLNICAERAGAEGHSRPDGSTFQKYWRTRISVAQQAAIGQSVVKFLAKQLSARSSHVQKQALAAVWDASLLADA
jgi:hypothetical protein